jgi:prolipoprotein diacylglyceryltransferase
VPIAVIQLDFDPALRFGDRLVRLETIGIAVAILVGLVIAGLIAGRTSAGPGPSAPGASAGGPGGSASPATGTTASTGPGVPSPTTLRRDDLLFIALGILPGAIVGGRLGWALGTADYVLATPGVLIDPGIGALTLGGAVLGGTLTGIYVAALLEAPVGRWLDALIAPVLVTLAIGKLAMVLGGSGQGSPFAGDWATAFRGPGPWGSVAPGVPAHPAQVYEAIADVAILVVVVLVSRLPMYRRHPDGRLFWTGVGLWSLARAAVATTWRDSAVWAGLGAEQVVALATAALAASFLLILAVRAWRRGRRTATVVRAT